MLIVVVAGWMMWRTWRSARASHDHHHDHDHDEIKRIDTGHGTVRLEVFEDGVPPRFRLVQEDAHH
ncbi:nickel/cobalt efflux protein RcnA, partial [Acinetobacter baumannii]